jgi:hypothetical protein
VYKLELLLFALRSRSHLVSILHFQSPMMNSLQSHRIWNGYTYLFMFPYSLRIYFLFLNIKCYIFLIFSNIYTNSCLLSLKRNNFVEQISSKFNSILYFHLQRARIRFNYSIPFDISGAIFMKLMGHKIHFNVIFDNTYVFKK